MAQRVELTYPPIRSAYFQEMGDLADFRRWWGVHAGYQVKVKSSKGRNVYMMCAAKDCRFEVHGYEEKMGVWVVMPPRKPEYRQHNHGAMSKEEVVVSCFFPLAL